LAENSISKLSAKFSKKVSNIRLISRGQNLFKVFFGGYINLTLSVKLTILGEILLFPEKSQLFLKK